MEIGRASTQANLREGITDHPAAIKRPKYLASRVCGNDKHGYGLDFQVRLAPNLALQLHTTMELLQLFAFPDLYALAHFLAWAFTNFPIGDFLSAFFVASQRASICSRGRSLNSRPDLRASASIARNRRENFAFAFFSAISGSTCRNRARFTAANSKSPISSSNFRRSLSLSAISSSAVSSRTLSITPLAFSQSKPMRDALRAS